MLTPRETEIVKLIIKGMLNKQIALNLGITEHTVKNHIRGIFGKTGLSNRTQVAIKYAGGLK